MHIGITTHDKAAAKIAAALLSAALLLAPARPAAAIGLVCRGAPLAATAILRMNWGDFLPIVIGGVPIGGINPPIVHEAPICVCPSHIPPFVPVPGIGISFWEPLYLAGTTRDPGCAVSLGGVNLLGHAYDTEMGQRRAATPGRRSGSLLQVHWYDFPAFALINAAANTVCENLGATFNLAGMTEIDPVWNNDLWSAIFSPEDALFANPVAQAACVVDALTSSLNFPLDPLFWCAGTWGSVYPLSGNVNDETSDQQGNALALSKFMAWEAHLGLLWTSVGPGAQCFAYPSPIWIKSQYRIDPIYPLPTVGLPVVIGETPLRWGYLPPENFPLGEDSAYVIWNAEQCCLRP